MGDWHPAAQLSDLDDGKILPVRIAGRSILLTRSQDRVHAIADRCSHADQELACGIVRNGWILCPAHGARFDLASGEPLNPPADRPIATYPVRRNGDMLEVLLPNRP